MGDGIYGVEAAAQEHFGVSASQLSKNQAALIAACLPNPRKYDAGNPSTYIQWRKTKIMMLMSKLGPVDFDKKPVAHKSTHRHKKRR